MLEKIAHIEGLDSAYDHVELMNDTSPTANQIWFDVVWEEMPFLSQQANRIIHKPFVHLFRSTDLGAFSGDRRVRDTLELDETTGKWNIKRLHPFQSDIKKYPDAWNAFYRGQTFESLGTPLSFLFKGDKSREERYKFYHVTTVEQLSALPETQIQELGMGARADVNKARAYLERTKAEGAAVSLNQELEEERKQRKALQSQVEELTAKLTEILSAELSPVRKPGRPRKQILESEA